MSEKLLYIKLQSNVGNISVFIQIFDVAMCDYYYAVAATMWGLITLFLLTF